MSSRLRVGILGSSFGGSVHAPAFAAHERFEVAAIASPNAAAEVARQRNIPAAYTSLAEMLDAERLDVLSIAAPPFAHAEAVAAACARKLHIVCEKPFAMSLGEAERCVALAADAGITAILAHEFRFLPTRIALKELLANEHLGPVRQLEMVQNGGFLRSDATRRRGWWFERARGGGIAGAWLSHAIDTVNWLMEAEPIRVSGFLRTAVPHRHDADGPFDGDVDDGAFALLEYADGAVARLCADGTLRIDASTLAVHGEKRTAIASGTTIHEQRLFAVDDDETAELELRPLARQSLAAVHASVPSFTAMLDAFYDGIQGKSHEAATFADGLATQRVLAQIGYGGA